MTTLAEFRINFKNDILQYLVDKSGKCRYSYDDKTKTNDIVIYVPKAITVSHKENSSDFFLKNYLRENLKNFKKSVNDSKSSEYIITSLSTADERDKKKDTSILLKAKLKPNFGTSKAEIVQRVRVIPPSGTVYRQFKAKDFLLSEPPQKEICYKEFTAKEKSGKSFYYTNADTLKKVIANSLKRNSNFDAVERRVIESFLETIDGGNAQTTDKLPNGFFYELPQIKNIVSLMAAFSEVIVPYLFLKGKIPHVIGVDDYSPNNVDAVAFPDFDIEKIDFVVFYKSTKNQSIKRMNFSMKWGAGHEVSVGDLLRTEGLNFQNSFLTELRNLFELYKNKTFSDIGVSDIFFIKESGCFDAKDGKIFRETEGVYSDLFKNSTEYKSKIDDYRTYLKENHPETYEKLEELKNALIKEADKLRVSYNKDTFKKSFPFSISKLVALMIATATDSKAIKNQLRDLILEGGYHQIRINDGKAKRGKLEFTIIPIFKNTDAKVELKFAVSSGWSDFKMESGSHFAGYRVW